MTVYNTRAGERGGPPCALGARLLGSLRVCPPEKRLANAALTEGPSLGHVPVLWAGGQWVVCEGVSPGLPGKGSSDC